MVSGEEDFTKRFKGKIDHWWIKGVEFQDPTIAACLPISIENPAIAYDLVNDRFKVDVEAMSVGTINVDPVDKWARQLGKIDLQRFLGVDISLANPILNSLVYAEDIIDPRNIRALDTSDKVSAYGSESQPLLQRAVTYDALAQIRHNGVEIDPRQIRTLTTADKINVIGDEGYVLSQDVHGSLKVTLLTNTTAYDARDTSDRAARLLGKVYGSQDVLQQRTTTKELIVQIQHQGAEKDPTQIRALTAADIVTVAREGTATHFSITSSGTIYTPAAGKKVRLLAFFWSSNADIITSLRFGSGGSDMFPLQKIGVSAMNLLGLGPLEGAADAVLYGYLSAAGTMKGTVFTVNV
jgi:hypothetical protein